MTRSFFITPKQYGRRLMVGDGLKTGHGHRCGEWLRTVTRKPWGRETVK